VQKERHLNPLSPRIRATLPLYPQGLAVLRQLAESVCVYAGLSKVCTHRIAVALDELYVNIHEHGYLGEAGEVECVYRYIDKGGLPYQVEIELRDYAPSIDDITCCTGICPETLKDNPIPGGLGMHLIEKISKEFEHTPLADGNRWRLLFQIEKEEGK